MSIKNVHGRWWAGAACAVLLWGPLALSAAPLSAPAQRVEAAARQWLAEQATVKGLVAPQFELSLVERGGTTPAAACAQAVAVEAVETRYLSRMRFAATCPGNAGWQREWIVRAEVSALVVVAAAPVQANRAMAEADLAQERRTLVDMADALPSIDAAVGQASTRALRSGQVVSPRWLVQPLLLKRGDSVSIVARNGLIEVQVPGEALEPGRRDQVVRVRNTGTGKVIRARVVEAGVVEPESMGQQSMGDQSRD